MWEHIIQQLVRPLINDLNEPYTYSEDRLTELVLYAAYLINQELTFDNTYTVSILDLSITPDPSSDEAFVKLTALKAALIVLFNELKTDASNSVRVVDGPSQIELGGAYKAKKELYDLLLRDYNLARTQHQMGNGKAILSAISIDNYSYLLG